MKLPKFVLLGFRRPHELIVSALGQLEREVMEELWRHGEMSVRDVHQAFEKRTAYTTLMTTLDRLHKKGLLNRRKHSRAFLYAARVSRAEFEEAVREDVVDGLLDQSTDGVKPVLSCIIDQVSSRDRALLDELERLIKEKKRELKRRS
ncbi:MAG: BlaI/MecI/CopY family transcriptional regulator [Acidobacteria bacterium]|nr:BlaI/MecI/CopY family transcriptional regulator [Acidobacteriota bacterium]